MAQQTKPLQSQSPDDKFNLSAALFAFMRGADVESERCLPAIVHSYNDADNVAVVQPLIQVVTTRDEFISRNLLTEINCLSLGAGGFHIHFPIASGDLGWIFASDRDLSLFKQSLAEAPPASGRFHKFADGIFIPDTFRKYSLAEPGKMVMQTTDGTTRISIGHDGVVTITAPTKLLCDTPDTELTGNLKVAGNTEIVGATAMQGPSSANGGFTSANGQPCTLSELTTIGDTSVVSHGHTQTAVPGARTSGGMIS